MSLLDITVLGHPILRQETTVVPAVTDELRTLIDDMFETMHAARGIGLAATQVGRTERIAVVDVEGARYALVNPEIVEEEGEQRGEEGCLSIPEVYGDVSRAARVRVRAQDRDGRPFEVEATGILAVCLQHEIDHLHGKLFIDYLSFLKRRAALAKWDAMKEKYPAGMRKLTPEELAELHDEPEDAL